MSDINFLLTGLTDCQKKIEICEDQILLYKVEEQSIMKKLKNIVGDSR